MNTPPSPFFTVTFDDFPLALRPFRKTMTANRRSPTLFGNIFSYPSDHPSPMMFLRELLSTITLRLRPSLHLSPCTFDVQITIGFEVFLVVDQMINFQVLDLNHFL